MAGRNWRHPRHDRPAIAAFVMCALSLAVILTSLLVTNLYEHSRDESQSGIKIISKDISCQDDICRTKQNSSGKAIEMTGWQMVTLNLAFAGAGFNGLSFLLQLVFWCGVMAGSVLHAIVRLTQICDCIGGILKFACAMTFVFHIHKANYYYAWNWHDPSVFQINPLPIGLIYFSYLLELMSFLGLTLVLDVGPPEGGTYWDLIDAQERLEHPEENEVFRRSSYMPDVKETHSKVLSSTQLHMQGK